VPSYTKQLPNQKDHGWLMAAGYDPIVWATEWVAHRRTHHVIEVDMEEHSQRLKNQQVVERDQSEGQSCPSEIAHRL